jgi:hypothetical protein
MEPNDWPCLLKNIIVQLVGSFLTKITQNKELFFLMFQLNNKIFSFYAN